MKQLQTNLLQSEWLDLGRTVGLVALGALWFPLCGLSISGVTGMDSALRAWVCVAAVFLVAVNQGVLRSLVAGARVLNQQRTPRVLWRRWLAQSVRELSLPWAMVTAASVLLLLPSSAPWRWVTGAAVFSAILCATAVYSFSVDGLIHRAWRGLFLAVGILLSLYVGLVAGLMPALNQLAQWPIGGQLALALSWPAWALWLKKYWTQPPARTTWTDAVTPSRLTTWLTEHIARISFLEPPSTGNSSRQMTSVVKLFIGGGTSYFYLFLYAWLTGFDQYFSGWGQSLGWVQLCVSLGLMIGGPPLMCRDLHWRYHLAPRRGVYWGWRIFAGSLVVHGICLVMVSLVCLVVARSGYLVSWSRIAEFSGALSLIFLQWVATLALLVFLTGLHVLMPVAVIGLSVCCYLAYVAFSGAGWLAQPWPEWVVAGPEYAASLIMVTLVLVGLANRVWTPRKLLRFLQA